MSESAAPGSNRRLARRRLPRTRVRIVCQRGRVEWGLNLALAILDISETGVRLLVREALTPGEDVVITLKTTAGSLLAQRVGTVVWAEPVAGGRHSIGVCLQKRLDHRELQAMT